MTPRSPIGSEFRSKNDELILIAYRNQVANNAPKRGQNKGTRRKMVSTELVSGLFLIKILFHFGTYVHELSKFMFKNLDSTSVEFRKILNESRCLAMAAREPFDRKFARLRERVQKWLSEILVLADQNKPIKTLKNT